MRFPKPREIDPWMSYKNLGVGTDCMKDLLRPPKYIGHDHGKNRKYKRKNDKKRIKKNSCFMGEPVFLLVCSMHISLGAKSKCEIFSAIASLNLRPMA